MPTQPQSASVPKTSRTVRDDICTTNPSPRTILNPWIVRSALVVHAKSTR
jgi:hypothetical protein